MVSPAINVRTAHVLSITSLTSCLIQVVRYTALAGGVLYGIVHQRTLQKRENKRKEEHEIHRREQLIQEAKEAWKRKQASGNKGGEFLFFSFLRVMENIKADVCVVADESDFIGQLLGDS
jgi:F-type H+-transporting ATP synthase subunit e